jgi:AraC-like DNA-binding protein
VYRVDRPKYDVLRVDQIVRPHWVLSHVVQGSVTMESVGHRFVVCTGAVMLHPPGITFSEWSENPGVHEVMHFDCGVSRGADLLRIFAVHPVVTLSDDPGFRTAFQRILAAWGKPSSPVRDLEIGVSSLEILRAVVMSWCDMGEPPRPAAMASWPDRFVELILFMHDHACEPLTRQALADVMHLHPNYLDRVFHQTLGQTPIQMLREIRLQKAVSLLAEAGQTVEEIAYYCGFTDAARFSRAFRKRFGSSPSAFRKSVKTASTSYIPPW